MHARWENINVGDMLGSLQNENFKYRVVGTGERLSLLPIPIVFINEDVHDSCLVLFTQAEYQRVDQLFFYVELEPPKKKKIRK